MVSRSLYIYPHEFLSLVCNCKKRLHLLQRAFKPEFGVKKREIEYLTPAMEDGVNKKEVFHLYEMADMGKLGEGCGKQVLFNICQREFAFMPPKEHNQGISLTLGEAGCQLRKHDQPLTIEPDKPMLYEL